MLRKAIEKKAFTMNDDLDWMIRIPVRVPQTLRIENVDLFPKFLSSSRVKEEFYLWMGTPERLL